MSDEALARWLLVQGSAFLAAVAVFGGLFPLFGGTLAALGVEVGRDGIAPWVTMLVGGPCTAIVYLPGGITSLYARRRLLTGADPLVPMLLAAVCCLVVCPLGVVPPLVFATRARVPGPPR